MVTAKTLQKRIFRKLRNRIAREHQPLSTAQMREWLAARFGIDRGEPGTAQRAIIDMGFRQLLGPVLKDLEEECSVRRRPSDGCYSHPDEFTEQDKLHYAEKALVRGRGHAQSGVDYIDANDVDESEIKPDLQGGIKWARGIDPDDWIFGVASVPPKKPK